jgi:hypothetical protein
MNGTFGATLPSKLPLLATHLAMFAEKACYFVIGT